MLNRLKEEAELLTKQISLMRSTAIELRHKGGEPSDTFKKLLCGKVARLKELNQDINNKIQFEKENENG